MHSILVKASSPSKYLVQVISCVLLIACSGALSGQEPVSTTSSSAEQGALKVLNDSDWAHTVKPTTQDAPCTYGNPAFPGLFPEDRASLMDANEPVANTPVRADNSEYLIRFQSARPVQTATQQLLAMGEKWSAYGPERQVSDTDAPTDLARPRYNVADMITVAVILKYAGQDGRSLFEYGYGNGGGTFPSRDFRPLWQCAGVRTSTGQVYAHLVAEAFGRNGYHALQLSFPRLIDGKPLISGTREKVEFRLVVTQHVFETAFYVNSTDVLDGSERSLCLPSAFTDLKELAQEAEN